MAVDTLGIGTRLAHIPAMAEAQITEADIKRAREIVAAHGSFMGASSSTSDKVARLVAQALAEGRAQGLELGLKMISGKARQ